MPWFIKTERFLRPYAQMKSHLDAHRRWVEQRRAEGVVLSSGYLVDGEGQPGGGDCCCCRPRITAKLKR